LASRKKIETLNENPTKGTPFETKPLRTIEIDNMEISEKIPTLAIEDEFKITPLIRKATIEEVPDEETLTLVADQQPISDVIIEKIPPLSKDSEDSDEEPLKAATLESDEIEDNEMIIAYIQEEPIIGIFKKKDALLTKEHDYPKYGYVKKQTTLECNLLKYVVLLTSASFD
jgi:hypothetical protein